MLQMSWRGAQDLSMPLARTREHNIVEREVVKEPATLVEEVVAAT